LDRIRVGESRSGRGMVRVRVTGYGLRLTVMG